MFCVWVSSKHGKTKEACLGSGHLQHELVNGVRATGSGHLQHELVNGVRATQRLCADTAGAGRILRTTASGRCAMLCDEDTVDSKKVEHGLGVIYACFLLTCVLGPEGCHIQAFWPLL